MRQPSWGRRPQTHARVMEHVGFHLPGEGKLVEDGMDVQKQSLERRTKNLCTEHSIA